MRIGMAVSQFTKRQNFPGGSPQRSEQKNMITEQDSYSFTWGK